jgi:hypothetical protein
LDNYLLPSHTLKFALEHVLMYEISGDFTNKYRESPKIGNYPSSACPYRENPKIGNFHTLTCPYVKQYTLVG